MAKCFEEMNNINGMMEVLTCLNFGFIKRLKQAWKGVSKKLNKTLEQLQEIMEQVHNYPKYRQLLKQRSPPIIPFLGIHLTDLTFIEENPDTTPTGLINFEKMYLIAKVLKEILRCQSTKYEFSKVNVIQEFLEQQMILSEDQLWSLSRKCEPADKQPEITY